MVAAQAIADPEIALKPPQARIVDIARPPGRWPTNA